MADSNESEAIDLTRRRGGAKEDAKNSVEKVKT
jgi:hypothetical protein